MEMQTVHMQSQGVFRSGRQFNLTPLIKHCYMRNSSGKRERKREGKGEKMLLRFSILTELFSPKLKHLLLESLFLLLLNLAPPPFKIIISTH